MANEWPPTVQRGIITAGPVVGPAGAYSRLKLWVTPVLPPGVPFLVHQATGLVLASLPEPVLAEPGAGTVSVELPMCSGGGWTTPGGTDPGPWEYRARLVAYSSEGEQWETTARLAITPENPLVSVTGIPDPGAPLPPTAGGAVTVTETEPGTYVVTGAAVTDAGDGTYTFSTEGGR